MFVVLTLLACGTPAEAPPTATPPAAPAPTAQEHGSHSDHMAVMDRTRSELRTALGDAYDAPVPGLDAADAARGKETYDQVCASCHGTTGKGDGPAAAGLNPSAADFTDAFHARYYSDAGRVRIIEQGSPGTAMAGFGTQLDRNQILDLYAYVRQFRGGASTPAPEGDGHEGHAGHH